MRCICYVDIRWNLGHLTSPSRTSVIALKAAAVRSDLGESNIHRCLMHGPVQDASSKEGKEISAANRTDCSHDRGFIGALKRANCSTAANIEGYTLLWGNPDPYCNHLCAIIIIALIRWRLGLCLQGLCKMHSTSCVTSYSAFSLITTCTCTTHAIGIAIIF